MIQNLLVVISVAFLVGCSNNSSSERSDTPATRLAAVKGHSVFHQLIQNSNCSARSQEATANCYTGQVTRTSVSPFDGQVRKVNERVYLFLDEQAGLFKSLHISMSGQGHSVKRTGQYTISGNKLRVEDYGVISFDEQNNFSIKMYDTNTREVSDEEAPLRALQEYQVKKADSSVVYDFFCN